MKPIPVTVPVDNPAHKHLGLGIFAAHKRHPFTALLATKRIHDSDCIAIILLQRCGKYSG
jgi:hypothetical protein